VLKPGGQEGHNGHYRAMMTPDEIIEIEASSICKCGGEMEVLSEVCTHQKVDIPEIKPCVVEYHLQKRRCKKCKKKITASLPEGVGYDTFGPKIKTAVASFSGFYKASKRNIQKICKDIFNLDISLGSISNSEERVSKKCKSSYETLKEDLMKSKVLHADETGHYNQGKRGWCWLFASSSVALITLAYSRGMKVLKSNIDADIDSTIVTDRYAAYNYFAEEKRQVCWAHISRDFERFANSSDADIAAIGVNLGNIAKTLFDLHKKLLAKEMSIYFFRKQAKKLRRQMLCYLKEMENNSKFIRAVRVARNIMKSDNMLWKFLEDPGNIPLTNNHAERAIRHYVVYRKNSYFTWSERGDRFIERITSLYLTWKLQGQNPYQNLLAIIAT
jgi:transposase